MYPSHQTRRVAQEPTIRMGDGAKGTRRAEEGEAMKTALGLLGDDKCHGCERDIYVGGEPICTADLELVARRARKEAYGLAAKLADEWGHPNLADEIRALAKEPTE